MENLLTVVIPAKNEEKFIGPTLDALVNQSYITPATPIYIADAGSTDHTLQMIDKYEGKLNIRLVKGGLPAVGRNNGARYANTKYIAFMDADIELGENDTLEKAVKLAAENDLDLVTTRIRCKNGNRIDNFFWSAHNFLSRLKIFGAYATGMFMIIKSQTFSKLGGFDETVTLGEDWELTHNIHRPKFSVCNSFILTTNRRFVSKGYLTTIAEYVMVAISKAYRHRNHTKYFDVRYN